jgi:geranylgeranyl pyrophosphate synthase
MSLGMNLWDDIVDKTMRKGVAPTTMARYGEPVTLMIGGLAVAKSFSILGEISLNNIKQKTVMRLVWDYCKRLAKGEALNLRLKEKKKNQASMKLELIEMKGINLEISSKIGSILGNGSGEETDHLGNYGRHLGAILELEKDFKTSINLTLELQERIKNKTLTYTIYWAKTRSKRVEENLSMPLTKSCKIKEIVESILETGALENVIKNMETHIIQGKSELSALDNNHSIRTLLFFLEAQPRIFKGLLADL